ncbi:MAG: protein-disulfide isomerase [Planctomycetota bacterium]|jgi:protein-disulfide isomerase
MFMSQSTHQSGQFTIPMAVLVSGVLIALAIVFGPSISSPQAGQLANIADTQAAPPQNGEPSELLAADVTKDDHIRGNQNADIFLIEYSDLDCPFCSRIHPTLEQIVTEYSNVGWVYRHNPLDSIHPEARGKAKISECIAQIAGEEAFWQYLEINYTGGDEADYTQYGTTQEAVDACVSEQETALDNLIDSQIARAQATGGQGTPHTIIANDDFGLSISGAQPLEVFQQILSFMNQEEE